jgi:hypothetical protein
MPSQSFPDLSRCRKKLQQHEARMSEHSFHARNQRTQRETIANTQRGRKRSVLCPDVEIAGTEHHSGELSDLVEGHRVAPG